MLDTGASSSIINYRTFWEICQTKHPISVKRSTIQTKTYSGLVVPMIGLATLTFSYDPDGQFTFPITVWITEMKIENLLGMDFFQKQVSGIHFELPGIELKEPPNTVCYGSLHQNKSYPFISRILTIRTPHAMHIEAKSASILLKILMLIFPLDQPFNQTAMLSLRDYHLPMCYATNQNQNYLF